MNKNQRKNIIRDFLEDKIFIAIEKSDTQYLNEFDKVLDGVRWASGNSINSYATHHALEINDIIYLHCRNNKIFYAPEKYFNENYKQCKHMLLSELFEKQIRIKEDNLMSLFE